ncbi:hypothetical protein [Latilactobacillus phage TMW 1.1397 P1]|nr:hypothetical protein [Latilactobacillus phage TMW 1.1397 P1]
MIAQKLPKWNFFIKKSTKMFTCYQNGAKINVLKAR